MRLTRSMSSLLRRLAIPLLALTAVRCGGGDGGGTAPPAVASVVITAPAGANAFQTLTRTRQLAAVARDAAGAIIPAATFTWASSNAGAVSVNGSGLVTAVANGSANIIATSGGIPSTPVAVTVAQVAAGLGPVPATVIFGAIGSTRQLSGSVADSSGAAVPGSPVVVWSRAGTGVVASVSAGGLITSLAVGTSDTAVATAGTIVTRVPITVTQLVSSVLVSPAAPDTLKTTGRTKLYTAVARDSNANTVPGATLTWSSTAAGVATVGAATGVATAIADGSTQITATAGGIAGSRPLVVRRYALTFTFLAASPTITTPGGTAGYNGTAQDSVSTPLPITWLSRAPTIAGVSPGSGFSTTATAVGNGATFIVMTAGTRADSAQLTVSGQAAAVPLTAAVDVGDQFFRSTRNLTSNAAVDTVGVGGTVTWSWIGVLRHDVRSTGAPLFTSSALQMSGSHAFLFNTAGTYTYECSLHSQMTGRIVVR